MKKFRNLTLALAALTFGAASAATDLTPDIIFPHVAGAKVLEGMSNNGLYGVAKVKNEDAGNTFSAGAYFYDFTGSQPKATNLAPSATGSSAHDVTDDGKLVVGEVNFKPCIWRYENGSWNVEMLPIPDDHVHVMVPVEADDDAPTATYKINGGFAAAVTPDGKYAVGRLGCYEYEMVEEGVMWDLTDPANIKIIELNTPVGGTDGKDMHQSRYLQLSNDGRYILCWNAFSYYNSVVFVWDRQENKAHYIIYKEENGRLTLRNPAYQGTNLDGITKSLTPEGRYVSGSVGDSSGNEYVFLFDVFNDELKVFNDVLYNDATAWSVTPDGIPVTSVPAVSPYVDGYILYDNFFFPVSQLLTDVYGVNLVAKGIDNTGKGTLISDDGRTIFFVTGQYDGYLLRLKEDLTDGIAKIDLMKNWRPSPAAGSKASVLSTVSFTFDNPLEYDASKASSITLTDGSGNVSVAKNVSVSGNRLDVNFGNVELAQDVVYTVAVPENVCWIKGRPQDFNHALQVNYTGRDKNKPVEIVSISPKAGTALANLDLNDNPVEIIFDVPVKVNTVGGEAPIAHLYVDDETEPLASLNIDYDVNSGRLVIFPINSVYLYKGSDYTIKVPAGAVTDNYGYGLSEAFEITYAGAFVPQMGSDIYLFHSTGDSFENVLVYEGDHGVPVAEYEKFGFTQDTTPWWVVCDDNSTDMAFASHSRYKDGRDADDWLMTRQILVPENIPAYLKFQGQSYRKNKTDKLKVYVYAYSGTINSLSKSRIDDIVANGDLVFNEQLSPGANEEVIAGEWTDYVVPLDAYAGKSIYIAFVNNNTYKDGSMVMIDNIEVRKDVSAFVTITSAANVVAQEAAQIKGKLSVVSDLADYNALSLTLKDSTGKTVSTISDNAVSLKAGDIYDFVFPQGLPLELGEEVSYSIEGSVSGSEGSDAVTYSGMVRNLAFQPEKRVVVEEVTGKTCPNCPLGILGMEMLESRFPGKIVPVALHAYGNGADAKGAGIIDYAITVFNSNLSAPNGIINRRPNQSFPAASYAPDPDKPGALKYAFTAAESGSSSNLWLDEVLEEFNEPAFLDVALKANHAVDDNTLKFTATVRSAINLTEQNVRVLGILLEDNLFDMQDNNLYMQTDPILGPFGAGGQYGYPVFPYTFNNVARTIWGNSVNGMAGLIPTTLNVGEEYKVEMKQTIPSIVSDKENLKMAVILIDQNTGRVINAAVTEANTTGVGEVADDLAGLQIVKVGSDVEVTADGDVQVALYTLDGRVLAQANGAGRVMLPLGGYNGIFIVRAVTANGTKTVKLNN